MGREKIKKGCCPLLGILHDGISSESLSSLFVSSPVKLRLTCEGLQVWQHWRHIKPAPKQTQLWASTQHLHDNSNRNSSRWSSLSQAVHYGWAAKPGPSSAPRAFLFLRLVRIRKKKKEKEKLGTWKMCQRQSASEWKVASQERFSNAWGLSSPMPCPHGCAHAHTHPVPFHTHASTTNKDSINTIRILQSPSTKVWGAPSLVVSM